MVSGLGIDMIEVERISFNINKDAGFKELVFSSGEIIYCESMPNKFQHYAARFAAKEAFFKALGTGWADGTAFNEVEIINDVLGKPEIVITGKTKETLSAYGAFKISVSLSHLATIASAVVIIEKES